MILENAMLRLLPAQEDLAQALAEYYTRNRAFFKPFGPVREEAFYTPECQRAALCGEAAAAARSGLRFYITPTNAAPVIIGMAGLGNIVWGAFCSAYLSYKLDAAFLNRG